VIHPRTFPSLFGLAPCGVYPASVVTAGAVRSYRTFSPLLPERVPGAVCFLWHWPSAGFEAHIPDVIRHTTLWSSDFPPPAHMAPAATARSSCQRYFTVIYYSPLLFRVVAHGFVDHLPACFGFAQQTLVEFAIEVIKFALEFAVAVEARGVNVRFGKGASRFAGVGAVAEPALPGDLLYVFKAGVEVGGRRP